MCLSVRSGCRRIGLPAATRLRYDNRITSRYRALVRRGSRALKARAATTNRTRTATKESLTRCQCSSRRKLRLQFIRGCLTTSSPLRKKQKKWHIKALELRSSKSRKTLLLNFLSKPLTRESHLRNRRFQSQQSLITLPARSQRREPISKHCLKKPKAIPLNFLKETIWTAHRAETMMSSTIWTSSWTLQTAAKMRGNREFSSSLPCRARSNRTTTAATQIILVKIGFRSCRAMSFNLMTPDSLSRCLVKTHLAEETSTQWQTTASL